MAVIEVEKTQNAKAGSIRWAYFRLPPFSPVAIRIMHLLNDEDDRSEELSSLISSDQAFASAVLTVANSALYAHFAPVTDVLRAIQRLGQRKLQGLCMSVAMMTLLSKQARGGMVRNLWTHSLACGLIAEMLAPGAGIDPGNAFTCGLLHDVGRLAMCVLQPEGYGGLLETHQGSPTSILERESDLFGFDHCDAGCELARSLALPTSFETVIKSHHEPMKLSDDWGLVDLVMSSCRIADATGFTAFPGCEAAPYPDLRSELPAKVVDRLYPDVESLAWEIRGEIKMLRVV
jgi:putative nucleotidyltransferase with HDIG domain